MHRSHYPWTQIIRAVCVLNAVIGCATTRGTSGCSAPCSTLPSGARVIPTRYVADRFIATPVLMRGDTAALFLDTGSSSFVMQSYLPWLQVKVVDSVRNQAGGQTAVVAAPAFRSDRGLPAPVDAAGDGWRLRVAAVNPDVQNNFIAWIARSTQGQLGGDWFSGRVWTFDYPHKRLLLESGATPDVGREVPLHFPTDSAGRRLGNSGYVDVVVEGDTVSMIFDTGASIWLSADALRQVGDSGSAERASSHIWKWVFARWHAQHPEWPVIEHASLYMDLPLIHVPNVSVAGYDLGPTWFSVWPTQAMAPTWPATAPAWQRRNGGTLGGSLLRNFAVTIDYPRATARFVRESSNQTSRDKHP